MKRLLVTGISGFLGWHVANHQQDDYELLGIYNQTEPKLENIQLASLNLTDYKAVRNFLEKNQPDAILHLACLLYTSPSPRDRTRSRMPSSA